MSAILVEYGVESPCGCITELVNGKLINILCSECEDEYNHLVSKPIKYKKTRMRESREI